MKAIKIFLVVLAVLSIQTAEGSKGVDYCPDSLTNPEKFESMKNPDLFFIGLEFISESPGPPVLATPPQSVLTNQYPGVLSCLYSDMDGNTIYTYYNESGNVNPVFNSKTHILKYVFNKTDKATQWYVTYEYNYAQCQNGAKTCPLVPVSIKKIVKRFRCDDNSVEACPFNIIEKTAPNTQQTY